MEKDGPRTREQGLCKHEDILLTRHLVLCRVLKWHQTHGVGAEMGLGVMSMQGPRGCQVSICYDWSLGDGRTGILENMSVALEQVNASLQ